MKKATIMAFLLVALAPIMQALAGGDPTTYYAALKAQVSSNSSGMGKVYAGTSNSAPSASSYKADYSQSSSQNSTTENEKKNFYAFAQANDGYEFVGWSTSNNGSIASAANPYTVQVSCSSDNSSSPTLTTIYANFAALPPATVTFAAPVNGSYTANGETISSQVVKADQPVPYSVTLVATPAANFRFAGWYVLENNSKSFFSTDATTTKKFDSDATVGAEFIPDGYTIYAAAAGKGYDNLATALGEAQSGESISIYDDVTLDSAAVIAKGVTLTVSAGKTLTVNGSLAVAGTLSINGTLSGSGTLYKISYLIDQGDVITITNLVTGEECGIIDGTYFKFIPRYRKTTVEANSPSISGTIGCLQSWGVLLNGSNAYAITSQNPTALKVTMNKTSAINEIESIGTEVSSITTTDNYLLLANCSLTGPKASNGRLNFQGVVDCAGKTLTASGAAYDSNFYSTYLNGNVVFDGSYNNYFQNGKAAIFNCSSVTVAGCKNGTNLFYLYDCGTAASPATLSFTYYPDSGRSLRDTCSNTNYRKLYIYSGYYDYTFNATNDGNSRCQVYGGAFTSDPTDYRASKDVLYVDPETIGGRNYNVVKTVTESAEVTMKIDDAEYETLGKAIAAAKNGDTIVCVATVDLNEEVVEIPQGLNVTIDMDGYTIQNGKIVNNGTLLLTDKETGNCDTVMSQSGGTVSSEIENNRTLDIAWGTYSGAIANKVGGTLTVHNGRFEGSIENSGGSVVLKGGHFKKSVYSEDSLAALGVGENCKIMTAVDQGVSIDCFSVFEEPNGAMVYSNGAYSVTPYNDQDYNLLKDWIKESKNSYANYSSNINDWTRLAELLSFYQVFNDKIIDAALVADRRIAANTLKCTGVLNNNISYPVTIKQQMDVGTTNYVLSAAVVEGGYTAIAYKYIFTHQVGAIKTIGLKTEVTGNGGPANNGTVCVALINFWNSTRASDYHVPDNMHMLTNSLYVAAKQRFTIGAGSNVAMIRPETGAATFYSTLDAAVEAVADGGTIMLANDTAENVTVSKACRIDTYGFNFTGTVTAGEGYTYVETDGVYDILKLEASKVIESELVSDDWKTENGLDANATAQEVQAVLTQTDDNGNAKWENLVIGQKADEKAAVTAANGGTETTATIKVSFEVPKDESTGEKIETGYKVKYAFDKVDETVEGGVVKGEAKEEPKPTLDFKDVSANEPTYFKMRAVLEATDNSGVTAEVPVEKTIGVVKVASDAEVTIIPVPWQSLGDTDIKATELVHAASLSDDDELIVYGADGKSQTWIVKNGEWTAPVAECTIGGDVSEPQQEEQQEAAELTRGQGAIIKRKDTTKEIVLIGQPVASETETVETPIAAATDDEPSWNLVASPKMVAVAVADVASSNTGDEIIVPTAGTPKHYTYKGDKWGYTAVVEEKEVWLPNGEKTISVKFGRKTDDTTVPAGQGFWYLNKDSSNNEKKIAW